MKKLIILILLCSCHKADVKTERTFHVCNGLKIKSNVRLSKKDLKRTCECYMIARKHYIKKHGLPRYNVIELFYFVPREFYRHVNNSDYAACSENKIYIRIFDVLIGTPDINEISDRKCHDKQHLLFHELYHIWSQDENNYNADEFAKSVPLC